MRLHIYLIDFLRFTNCFLKREHRNIFLHFFFLKIDLFNIFGFIKQFSIICNNFVKVIIFTSTIKCLKIFSKIFCKSLCKITFLERYYIFRFLKVLFQFKFIRTLHNSGSSLDNCKNCSNVIEF